ncbi:ergothioneine biosynthesis glutamate--cysteine ligase EgtA [Nocardia aurantiaca]|uniref:Glutamate--cysteine ligase EgtA n=1 Tax=Nocardia aurantiaca TaxID=2675850 RepID=A0A6I3L799_9NOCA|nr:ergothioneine biosynthesis glutamate--cysteine ligase EgtA [Nocardia aurantiaca]MTE16395.1 ergothioneine biosynthesis glutamate--cysteine ligase EgtA [Nocardia aurantiaca]
MTCDSAASARPGTADLAPAEELPSRAAAEAYIGGVCFKQGPPTLIGAELEWLTAEMPKSAPTGAAGPRPAPTALAAALGPYAPRSIAPHSPALPLPAGSRVTVEPGGQIELSSAPFEDADDLCERLGADVDFLDRLLESRSIRRLSGAADPKRRPHRVLCSPRYRAMERVFDGIGPFGKLMMCSTAATQVSVDAGGDAREVAARWRALYTIGPALVAAFACSPTLRGAPAGDWASQRMRAWLRLDRTRTQPPVCDWTDPVSGYSRWALDVPLLCVRRPGADAEWTAPSGATFGEWLSGALDEDLGRRPGIDDLDYHLTTLFPPVRPVGHLEIRYLDAQPGPDWRVPVWTIEALLSAPRVIEEATAVATPVAGRWRDAARDGLADPGLRGAAVELLALAEAHARTPDAARDLARTVRRCRDARTPDCAVATAHRTAAVRAAR